MLLVPRIKAEADPFPLTLDLWFKRSKPVLCCIESDVDAVHVSLLNVIACSSFILLGCVSFVREGMWSQSFAFSSSSSFSCGRKKTFFPLHLLVVDVASMLYKSCSSSSISLVMVISWTHKSWSFVKSALKGNKHSGWGILCEEHHLWRNTRTLLCLSLLFLWRHVWSMQSSMMLTKSIHVCIVMSVSVWCSTCINWIVEVFSQGIDIRDTHDRNNRSLV
jgi:hypothetical protein